MTETNPASDIDAFVDHLWLECALEDNTLAAYASDLKQFQRWLPSHCSLRAVQKETIRQYLRTLSSPTQATMRPKMTVSSQRRVLSTLRRFYRWLLREAYITHDPLGPIAGPGKPHSLPHTISEDTVEQLLQAPDLSTPLGIRNRSMLEMLYATGVRVSELVNLSCHAVSVADGMIRVMGKGGRERLVPLGEEALLWLERYRCDSRPQLLKQRTHAALFVTNRAQPMTRQAFWYLIKRYALQIVPPVTVSPHTLRHAFATHLINHGADLRVVQLLLGHADISTTQIYTHVAQHRLAMLHQQHHPRG